ncbi:hypothetical protein SEA_XKCD426_71 [Streptomyces phage Xkcd426]|nr:hypothetical protein SEA_XKCD426_71 [Streptomyces phage Xkcd426]
MKHFIATVVLTLSALDLAGVIEMPEWVSAVLFGIILGIVLHTLTASKPKGDQ